LNKERTDSSKGGGRPQKKTGLQTRGRKRRRNPYRGLLGFPHVGDQKKEERIAILLRGKRGKEELRKKRTEAGTNCKEKKSFPER